MSESIRDPFEAFIFSNHYKHINQSSQSTDMKSQL